MRALTGTWASLQARGPVYRHVGRFTGTWATRAGLQARGPRPIKRSQASSAVLRYRTSGPCSPSPPSAMLRHAALPHYNFTGPEPVYSDVDRTLPSIHFFSGPFRPSPRSTELRHATKPQVYGAAGRCATLRDAARRCGTLRDAAVRCEMLRDAAGCCAIYATKPQVYP
jgi:hypothetical protein